MKNSVSDYLSESKAILDRMDRGPIVAATELLVDAWKRNARVFIAGNGGSASTATHFACDLNKWASQDADRRFRAFSLVDNIPLVSALTNDNGFNNVYSEQLENFFEEGDVFVAISVHGGSGRDRADLWSQNLLKAADYAKQKGGKTLALVGFDGGVLKKAADVCVLVPADSTPQVEGLHLVLTHLICDEIRKRIVPPGKVAQKK
ncbi:MAG: SIS domain-containing protein [Nitrososphaerota archaeon]|nr:SIS domain-containing protein [Nitrososphaerota archaeon]